MTDEPAGLGGPTCVLPGPRRESIRNHDLMGCGMSAPGNDGLGPRPERQGDNDD
jgi:hypothetical protein